MRRRTFLHYTGLGLASAPFHSLLGSTLNASSGNPFLEACQQGDVNVVKDYLQAHSDWPQLRDEAGRSGFVLALLHGRRHIADLLKSHGYEADLHEAALDLDWERFNLLTENKSNQTIQSVNQIHPIGGSAMWCAAKGGAGSGIWRVYAKGGDPDGKVKKGQTTPLQAALRFPDLATAEMTAATLLGNNADPNISLSGDESPIHIAAERGSHEMVEMLIRLGASPEIRNTKGETPQQVAARFNHGQSAKILANADQIKRTCHTSRHAYTAAGTSYERPGEFADLDRFSTFDFVGKSHGDEAYVKDELDKQPLLVHSTSTTSEMCIEAAAHMGRKPIVEVLLNAGAPYSLPTAVMMGDMSTTKKLLDEDPARIHERGAHDFALLWYPIIGQCDLSMMELLLQKGVSVEDQHFLGTTALHWASMRSNLELIELLLQSGANINRRGRKFGADPKTPLQMAKDAKVIGYLKSKGAKE